MPPITELTGRYYLHELIAVGGMGEVWRAADQVLARPVAVKLLRPEYSGDEVTLIRFRAGARHAGLLTHPGIAQVYDYQDATPERPAYLVMELVSPPAGPSTARDRRPGTADRHHRAGQSFTGNALARSWRPPMACAMMTLQTARSRPAPPGGGQFP